MRRGPWVLAALVAACGSSGSESTVPRDAADATPDAAKETTDAGANDTTVDLRDAADGRPDAPRALYGGALVEFVPETYTSFLASFFDRPRPNLAPLDSKQEQGGCRLLVPRPVACSPACAVDSVCTGINTCSSRPEPVDVGVLHVEGLGGMNHDLQPTAPTVLIYQIVTSLPFAACKEGEAIKVEATEFSATGKCISPLAVAGTAPIPVTAGQPMHLAWTPPGALGGARIEIELEISHHGGFKGQIECDVPDTGSFDIPAPLITALVNLGRAGYPTVKLARTLRAPASTQPEVTLTVRSPVEIPVDTGVISCGAANSPPCATGTVCRPDFTCGPMS